MIKNNTIKRIGYLFKRFFLLLISFKVLEIFKKTYNFFTDGSKIDLDKLNIDKDLSLDDLFLKFGTDKGTLDGKKTYDFLEKKKKEKSFNNYFEWISRKNPKDFEYQFGHNFTPHYEKYFRSIRDKPLKILEIGVANGHSIASWFKYFPNAEIIGVDIKKSYYFFYKAKRIKYVTLDCTNDKDVNNFLKKNGKFDIIIDDSDHTYEFFTSNLKKFYPSLSDGGIYALEDFISSDILLKLEKDYNESNGKRMMRDHSLLMDEMFNLIKKKEIFDHHILDKYTLKNIFDTVSNVEVHYGDHPTSSVGFLFKK